LIKGAKQRGPRDQPVLSIPGQITEALPPTHCPYLTYPHQPGTPPTHRLASLPPPLPSGGEYIHTSSETKLVLGPRGPQLPDSKSTLLLNPRK
jgi:hypothetical protein